MKLYDGDCLTTERAESVRKMLQSRLGADRNIEIIGKCAEEPLVSNTAREGRWKNRRVDFIVIN